MCIHDTISNSFELTGFVQDFYYCENPQLFLNIKDHIPRPDCSITHNLSTQVKLFKKKKKFYLLSSNI